MPFYDQSEFDMKCEWGLRAVEVLAPISDAIVIVDVLSFSTAIDIATARGAFVFPYQWKSESALEYARSIGAELADPTRKVGGWSLSPASQENLEEILRTCSSGKELIERGFMSDIEFAMQLNVSFNIPILKDGFYSSWKQV